LRQSLDSWFESENIHPAVVAEFQDSALLKTFAQAGKGLFVAPNIAEREVRQQYDVRVVGRLDSIREQFYAISLKRKLDHPVMAALAGSADGRL
jgi:LysR family transcriptional activator of nhaA